MELILIDTNIVLYIIKGLKSVESYLNYELALSDISIIELLGVKDIDEKTQMQRQGFIDNVFNYPLNYAIRETAISIKQKYTLKIPDAIIASTAITHKLLLVTADKDFKKIKELTSIIVKV